MTPTSELMRVIVIFEKVPMNMTFGVNVKVSESKEIYTKIELNSNCSIIIDRSNSGETLGNSSYFKYIRPASTEFACQESSEVKMELVIDNNSVEAFFFDWYSLTTLIFTDKANKGINIWSELDENYIRVKYLKADVLKKTMGVEK
jgi:sucrose-6-phosphate hydrolase SacC (GH32 family)